MSTFLLSIIPFPVSLPLFEAAILSSVCRIPALLSSFHPMQNQCQHTEPIAISRLTVAPCPPPAALPSSAFCYIETPQKTWLPCRLHPLILYEAFRLSYCYILSLQPSTSFCKLFPFQGGSFCLPGWPSWCFLVGSTVSMAPSLASLPLHCLSV